jgi:hypothetical protein
MGFGPENKKRARSLCSAPFSFSEIGFYRLMPAKHAHTCPIARKIEKVNPASGFAGAHRLISGNGCSFWHVSLFSPDEPTI